MPALEVKPFQIDVPDAVLDDLRDRLARTRWPDQIPGSGWGYGTDRAYLQDLCEYWRTSFDWRAVERALNRWPHFLTSVFGGQQLHFIHARSPVADALPLIVTHGWPGSVYEFVKILGPLSDPAQFGGDPADAFHVVCPSIPGYGWSGPTTEPDWDIVRVAEANAALMARLGYERYGAQGGDWGAVATATLGRIDADHLAGIHMNMIVAQPPEGEDPAAGATKDELANLAAMQQFRSEETGYQSIQGSKPQTLAYGLNDSPAGLAGWIVEKFRTWSDCGGDVESRFTKDELLANITIYWVTETIGSSVRLYCETRRAGRRGQGWGTGPVEVPTGCAVFPGELARPPRHWVEKAYNLVHWTEMPRGGHFAALEEPDLLVEDIREFFRPLR